MSILVNDWPHKFQALRFYASGKTKSNIRADAQLYKYFWDELVTSIPSPDAREDADDLYGVYNSIRNVVGRWSKEEGARFDELGKDGEPTRTALWLKRVAKEIGYNRGIADLVSAEFGALISDTRSDFSGIVRQMIAAGGSAYQAVASASADAPGSTHLILKIDPSYLATDPEEIWERTGVVDQKYMYISPFSMDAWARYEHLTEGGNTAFQCRETIPHTLELIKSEPFDDLIFLGAGSPEKELKLIERLLDADPGRRLRIVYVDTSIFMLSRSARQINQSRLFELPNLQFELLCFDFTEQRQWRANLSCDPERRKLALILGQTIGNVRERHFIDVLRNLFHPGDLVVVGADFYDSRAELLASEAALLEKYRSKAAKNLVLAGIDHLLARASIATSEGARLDFIDAHWAADAHQLDPDLSSSISGTSAIWYQTAHGIKVPRPGQTFPILTLSASRRYVKPSFVVEFGNAAGLELIGEAPLDKKQNYRHLIFKRVAHAVGAT